MAGSIIDRIQAVNPCSRGRNTKYGTIPVRTPLPEAVFQGSLDRLAPILMTALTTGLALIPLALGAAEAGNEIQSPLAQVVLGGLLTSTLLSLFVLPAAYRLWGQRTT